MRFSTLSRTFAILSAALPVAVSSALPVTTSAALGFALLAPASLALPPAADTVALGLSIEGERPVGLYDAYATLPNGDRVVFDGTTMWREAADGTFLVQLGTTSTYVFPSFVLPDATSTYALIGESSRGKIYKVDLAGAGAQALVDLDFNFDAEFEDAGHALVSAAPCGFACGSELYRLDVNSGALSLVGSLSGPSGPLAFALNGDLYYGQIPNFPATDGSILKWTQAQVSGGVLLTEASASVIASAIVPASSMTIEPVHGHLFASLPVFGGTSEIVEYMPSGQLLGSVVQSLDYVSGVEFLRVQGIGSFRAFQPDGTRLLYRGTDYNANTSDVTTVRARRPRAQTSGPGLTGPGNVFFTVRGAHPNASIEVLMGLSANYGPNESSYDRGTWLFHTGMPLAGIRRVATVATDATGEGSFTFFNSGGQEGTRVFQALVRNGNGTLVGSSTAAFN